MALTSPGPVLAEGQLRKMGSELDAPVRYVLPLGDTRVPLNPLLGQELHLRFLGEISCIHCGRSTRKSFSQGYCYPCFRDLAQCDSCIVKPEQCHYFEGTCREPEWGEANCMRSHFVYLANSSGLKVGITRGSQVPTRWIDQGATQALPIFRVDTRQQSGFVEVLFKGHVADRTDWRAMLKGPAEPLDLAARRDRLMEECAGGIEALQQRFGLQAIQPLPDVQVQSIDYPVIDYPRKVSALSFDKTPDIRGRLLGIKGQYLILDCGVLNVRKFGAYHVAIHA